MSIVLDGTNGITTPQINAGNIVGQVCFFGMTTAPDGFLKANGAAISRTTFAALFAAIGTTYGAGDGSTTFNLPDLRGEFPRGFDDGRGVDSGRGFGSAQLDQMQRIFGRFDTRRMSAVNFVVSASDAFSFSNSGPNHGFGPAGESFTNRAAARVSFSNANSPNARVSADTTGETRSRNVALLACIKF